MGNISCRYVEGPPSELTRGGTAWAGATGALYIGASIDVKRNDVITLDEHDLTVIGIVKPSDRAFYAKAIVREVERGSTVENG